MQTVQQLQPQQCGGLLQVQRPSYRPCPAMRSRSRQTQLVCRAQQQEPTFFSAVRSKAAAVAAAGMLAMGSLSGAALANELDIMQEPRPSAQHIIDDAGVINRTTRKAVNDELVRLEIDTGYRLEVVTVRKLEFENDAFGFADKIIEKWYPTVEEGNKKGLLLIVTTAKDGALTGGPQFTKTVGDALVDSIISDNIPILGEEAKFNETVTSSLKRVEAALKGETDPGPPARVEANRGRTYKTKEETASKKGVSAPVVATLLFIAVVVPMLQYWGYTSED